jgi:hypothetical protein
MQMKKRMQMRPELKIETDAAFTKDSQMNYETKPHLKLSMLQTQSLGSGFSEQQGHRIYDSCRTANDPVASNHDRPFFASCISAIISFFRDCAFSVFWKSCTSDDERRQK